MEILKRKKKFLKFTTEFFYLIPPSSGEITNSKFKISTFFYINHTHTPQTGESAMYLKKVGIKRTPRAHLYKKRGDVTPLFKLKKKKNTFIQIDELQNTIYEGGEKKQDYKETGSNITV